MRLFLAILIACLAAYAKPPEGFKKTYRYFKITCSSSNITCVNSFCFLKNSRNDSTYSAGCDIIKNVTKVYVSSLESSIAIPFNYYLYLQFQLTVSYRFLNQYRQFLKYPRIELCSIFESFKRLKGNRNLPIPLVGNFNESYVRKKMLQASEHLEKNYPNKILRCSLESNFMKDYNSSSRIKNDFETILPNGDYRYERRFYNDEDDNIYSSTVYEAFNTREDSFF